jgi:hypothetical protein
MCSLLNGLASLGNLDLSFAYNTQSQIITEVEPPQGLAGRLKRRRDSLYNKSAEPWKFSKPNNNLHLQQNLSKGISGMLNTYLESLSIS